MNAGEQIAARGRTLAGQIQQMLEQARKEKDILRVNCLNRKLTEVNATSSNVTARLSALKAAAQANDTQGQNHEYTVLSVLGQKLTDLSTEASQCLGQSNYESGAAAQVVTSVSPSAPAFNAGTVAPPPPPPPSVTVPPPLSPVR